ncbi:C45 family autoproteolytic acyltransferase/hydolase [Ottowia thiooxydans]|uniref:C45 family autoproteolytic acyltransferase/hydolase n=1 Tax=Ottowia thiooxydans TaxID=219182 RepID=UPI00040DBA5A|nr:C45 family peptidase [Ottowia thiooxydans]
MIEPFPLIDVSGAPFERGFQHGNLAEKRIRAGVAHYMAQLKKLSLTPNEVKQLVEEYLPVMEAFDANHVKEMRGIAQGSGLPFEDIVLLNARTEILKLGERPHLRKLLTEQGADGCTGLMVLPEASERRTLIHALNWDWKRDCVDSSIVLRIRNDDGPDILTFTEAGTLARAGLNAAGVAITGNYLECDRDYSQVGVPISLVRRKVLENEHLALAMHAVCTTQKSASSNMMVSHAAGIGINFECAPNEAFQILPERGLMVHANHWINVPARIKLLEKGIAAMPDTLYRDTRVRMLLEPKVGAITVDDVKAALFDELLSPWSVCRPPRLNTAGVMTATVAMVVMQPEAGIMEVAPLPALNRHFTTYRLGAQVDVGEKKSHADIRVQ